MITVKDRSFNPANITAITGARPEGDKWKVAIWTTGQEGSFNFLYDTEEEAKKL